MSDVVIYEDGNVEINVEFKGNLLNIYQSFRGVDLLPSLEAKAADPDNKSTKHIKYVPFFGY